MLILPGALCLQRTYNSFWHVSRIAPETRNLRVRSIDLFATETCASPEPLQKNQLLSATNQTYFFNDPRGDHDLMIVQKRLVRLRMAGEIWGQTGCEYFEIRWMRRPQKNLQKKTICAGVFPFTGAVFPFTGAE